MKKGKWSYTLRLSEAKAARAWGLTPSQFKDLPEMDKAEMIATERTETKMSNWDMQVQEKEARKRDRRGGR